MIKVVAWELFTWDCADCRFGARDKVLDCNA